MKTDYDIIIVGAGAVGAALAAALAGTALRIGLIEAREPAAFDIQAPLDLRVFAISRASENILRGVGAWPAIEAARTSPYHAIQVWQQGGRGKITFNARDVGEANLGHIIENKLLQSALLEQATQHPNVTPLWSQRCTGLTLKRGHGALALEDGRELRAQLIVAADGARSRLRQWANIDAPSHAYGQRAVVSHLTPTHAHGGIARQVFTRKGDILALLPLADGRASLVWSTREVHAKELLALDDAAFEHAVTEASENALGAIRASDRRASFPLVRMHAAQYAKPHFALVGDAAHAVHPLAGQGVNLGLMDAAVLAETLQNAGQKGRSIGALNTLRRYARTCRADNTPMIWSFDAIQKLFGAATPLNRIGGASLAVVNRLAPAKKAFIKQALGQRGDLPKLARPR